MKAIIALLLLCSCNTVRVKGYVKSHSTIKVCGSVLTNFNDVEDEAQNICGRNMSVLKCDYEITGYVDFTPIKGPCCAVYCPDYSNRRRHD